MCQGCLSLTPRPLFPQGVKQDTETLEENVLSIEAIAGRLQTPHTDPDFGEHVRVDTAALLARWAHVVRASRDQHARIEAALERTRALVGRAEALESWAEGVRGQHEAGDGAHTAETRSQLDAVYTQLKVSCGCREGRARIEATRTHTGTLVSGQLCHLLRLAGCVTLIFDENDYTLGKLVAVGCDVSCPPLPLPFPPPPCCRPSMMRCWAWRRSCLL